VRALITEYIGASGIERLLEPVSIPSPRFDQEVEKLENTDARASEMEHAIKRESKVRFEENPVFYQTLRQRLEHILAGRKLERISAAEELKRMRALVQQLRSVNNIAQSMGLTETSFAIYELPLQEPGGDGAPRAAESRAIHHAEDRTPDEASDHRGETPRQSRCETLARTPGSPRSANESQRCSPATRP